MLQQNIWHIAKYQDIKIIRNLCKRPNTANVHFHFPLRNIQGRSQDFSKGGAEVMEAKAL